ncbi:hypothetical protein ACFYT3_06840 [Nocardia amikacinitolerans]|uniref:hypothetical protein n=1 Tax=Nocardia amikacinitolerans TaxID=756689 RepID=UPI0036BFC29C
MNIAVSGYTAAGKTTHARLLAEEFGYENVWASGLLLEKLGYDNADESHLWFERGAEIARKRDSNREIDSEVDRYLTQRARDESSLVFDARFLPWVSDSKCVRIWIESDLLARARKCHGSLGNSSLSVEQCAVSIYQKDALDIARMAMNSEAVFGPDRALFDIIVDNSGLTAYQDPVAAARGIALCHDYLCAAVDAVANGNMDGLNRLRESNPGTFYDVVRCIRH